MLRSLSEQRPWTPAHAQKLAAVHPAGIGRHVETPLGLAEVIIPQHVHLFSQYSLGPHVDEPHGTEAAGGAASVSGAPLLATGGAPGSSPVFFACRLCPQEPSTTTKSARTRPRVRRMHEG